MNKPVKVIDIFSGPGGLGEGFSQLKSEDGTNAFKISVSVEKDEAAYNTLLLRSFFRQFGDEIPDEYYQFLKGELGETPEEKLFKIEKFSSQVKAAKEETHCLELGKNNRTINRIIEKALGEDECILIGGPPCQAYSVVGRSRNKGIVDYKPEEDHRNFLYKEYLKIIAQFQPKAFVMENVKGMLSAKVNGKSIYESIFKDLHNPCGAINVRPKRGYSRHEYKVYSFVTDVTQKDLVDPRDFIIKSEDYGIPQGRHRVILLGIREDTNINPKDILLEKKKTVTLKQVISDLPKLRSGLSRDKNSPENWVQQIKKGSQRTIESLLSHNYKDVAEEFESVVSNLSCPREDQGKNLGIKRTSSIKSVSLKNWFYDESLKEIVTNHETRGHIVEDLQRYLFCSCWSRIASIENWEKNFPKSKDYPPALVPNHANFKSGNFADRFRTQIFNKPATTITSHISKDGHYYIHPDPSQCRSLTVREAARIQTFPDNYFFCGTRTQQYIQVGNAVPPLLAYQIAHILMNILTKR